MLDASLQSLVAFGPMCCLHRAYLTVAMGRTEPPGPLRGVVITLWSSGGKKEQKISFTDKKEEKKNLAMDLNKLLMLFLIAKLTWCQDHSHSTAVKGSLGKAPPPASSGLPTTWCSSPPAAGATGSKFWEQEKAAERVCRLLPGAGNLHAGSGCTMGSNPAGPDGVGAGFYGLVAPALRLSGFVRNG